MVAVTPYHFCKRPYMNYSHAFHAGNFADVHKHVILWHTLQLLQRKETPLLLLDTHAGSGKYDFLAEEASRSPEYTHGIALYLRHAPPNGGYEQAIRALNTGELRFYAGSPMLLQQNKRRVDRIVLCETQPASHAALTLLMHDKKGVKIRASSGYDALVSLLPRPAPMRAMVLIDPPYEQPTERAQCLKALQLAFAKMPTATFLVWSPLTTAQPQLDFMQAITAIAQRNKRPTSVFESVLYTHQAEGGLRGSVMQVINPPYGLTEALMPQRAALQQLGRLSTGVV